MAELKACPFCGGKAEENNYITNTHMVHGTGWIGCCKCRVFMDYTHGEYGRKLAIKAWNRRVKS